MGREKFTKDRVNNVDHGIGTLQDGYTSAEELTRICGFFVNTHGCKDMRNMVAQLLSNHMTLRVQTARSLELADFSSVELSTEGHGECRTLAVVLRQGKTNRVGRLQFGACL